MLKPASANGRSVGFGARFTRFLLLPLSPNLCTDICRLLLLRLRWLLLPEFDVPEEVISSPRFRVHLRNWMRMLRNLLWVFLLLNGAAAAKPPTQWQTLTGDAPAVIARGGFSGLFPDSSQFAYQSALATSLSDVILFCDLQLARDGTGFCQSDLRLDNSTNIALIYPKGEKTYSLNGEFVRGWFSIDWTSDQLVNNVSLVQNILSRPSAFDGSLPMFMVEDVSDLRPPRFWLNVEYSIFLKQHNQDAVAYISEASRNLGIDYISSPEISFLKSISGKVRKGKTKLVFRFLDADAIEPSTKQPYGSLLKDLKAIKTFASGILVPKTYIWPVNANQYLESHTTLVEDAHKEELEVFASGFANDLPGSYNYSYDPTAEYLQFIDNSEFSVDGVLTDFPSTASEAIACLAQNKNNTASTKGKPLIITHNGASGVFAGCTDLSYQQAVEDRTDIVDCSVQLTKDGVVFCLGSADLMGYTTAMTSFMPRSTMIPEIQQDSGIFSFDLTWSEIQSLKPELKSPLTQSGLARNPAVKNQGNFMTLAEFLDFAKDKAVSGILINIQNAAYLASSKGLDVVGKVTTALSNASYDKQTTQQVLIQSDDSAVLSKFKQVPSYKRVLLINETISDAPKTTVEEIKKFADSVNIRRSSIASNSGGFLSSFTDVVDKMHAADISVYVGVLRNEFVAIAFDFFSDPMVEMATYISVGVDGLVTEFPATASAFMRSPCSNLNADLPYTILPAEPGSLLQQAVPDSVPPSEAPAPALTVSDVVDPPLPPVLDLSAKSPAAVPTSTPHPSGQPANAVNASLCLLLVILCILSLRYH